MRMERLRTRRGIRRITWLDTEPPACLADFCCCCNILDTSLSLVIALITASYDGWLLTFLSNISLSLAVNSSAVALVFLELAAISWLVIITWLIIGLYFFTIACSLPRVCLSVC